MKSDRRALAPLDTLLESKRGAAFPLTPRLSRLYGRFRMAVSRPGSPRILTNFVTTLDGVASLQVRGHEGGGDISGFNAADRLVMGLLRAVVDAVVLGSGSIDADPSRLWTPETICPELASEYRRLRRASDQPALKVVVSGSGRLNLHTPVFAAPGGPLLIVTTRAGAKRLARQKPCDLIAVRATRARAGVIAAGDILAEINRLASPARILLEGGPRLLAAFHAERLVDEHFQTLSPQLAGRMTDDGRLNLVMGMHFAPKHPRWGRLGDVRRCGSHLFLRYFFR
jgi:riboflavin biosynthesis pyrimidine reductase